MTLLFVEDDPGHAKLAHAISRPPAMTCWKSRSTRARWGSACAKPSTNAA